MVGRQRRLCGGLGVNRTLQQILCLGAPCTHQLLIELGLAAEAQAVRSASAGAPPRPASPRHSPYAQDAQSALLDPSSDLPPASPVFG